MWMFWFKYIYIYVDVDYNVHLLKNSNVKREMKLFCDK